MWLTIVVPIFFLILVDLLRHEFFSAVLHTLPGFAATYVIAGVAVTLFSLAVFGLVDRLERRVTEQNRRLSTLNALAQAATERLDLDGILSTGLDHVLAVTGADAGLICLIDSEREEHTAACHRGFSPAVASGIQRAKLRDDPVATEVVRTGRPVVFTRVLDDPLVAEAVRREGIKAGISTPLRCEGEVNGILVIATRRERVFSGEDEAYLTAVGGQLGLAIRNATLYRESQRRNRELGALLAAGKASASTLEIDEVLRLSLDAVLGATSADAAEVWLLDDDDEQVMRCHRNGDETSLLERTRYAAGAAPGLLAIGAAAAVHDPLATSDLRGQPLVAAGFRSVCSAPLHYGRKQLGVLLAAAREPDAFRDRSELRLLAGLGEWLGPAIENARLYRQVQDQAVVQERERIARELHDGVGQVLGYINTQTLAVRKLLDDRRLPEAMDELGSMQDVARALYGDVRESILGLRTGPGEGLIKVLRGYLERYAEIAGLRVELDVPPEAEAARLPPSAEIQLIRVVQEALSNVRKHARARSVAVKIAVDGPRLRVQVHDDGRGFDPGEIPSMGWPRFGLQTMRERAESIGGEFIIEASPGTGTRLTVRVPVEAQPVGAVAAR